MSDIFHIFVDELGTGNISLLSISENYLCMELFAIME